MGLVGLWD